MKKRVRYGRTSSLSLMLETPLFKKQNPFVRHWLANSSLSSTTVALSCGGVHMWRTLWRCMDMVTIWHWTLKMSLAAVSSASDIVGRALFVVMNKWKIWPSISVSKSPPKARNPARVSRVQADLHNTLSALFIAIGTSKVSGRWLVRSSEAISLLKSNLIKALIKSIK